MSTNDNKKIIAGVSLLALSSVIAVTAIATPSKSGIVIMSSKSVATNSNTVMSNTTMLAGNYKDGSYSAIGKYYSPGGQESIKVSLTLKNNLVTDSQAESGANDPTASSYQSIFISNYKKFVIGKKITSIKLANVSGSSLTSQGFQDALKQIEKQTKA
jgi:hypothetical protein